MRTSTLLASLGLFAASSASAGTLSDLDLPMLEESALIEVATLPRAAALDVTPRQTLRWMGGAFVQMDQTWNGLPVHGARLTAAYDPDGSLRRFVGTPLAQAPALQAPSITAVAAQGTAEEYVATFKGNGSMWPSRSELGVLAQDGDVALTWVIDVSTSEPVGAWRIFVDAGSGEVLGEQQELFTARANVYASNPTASDLEEVELLDVDGVLRNDYAWTSSCTDFDDQAWQCNAKEVQALPDSLGDFFFEPLALSTEDPFAEVQMFYHLDLVARWFEDMFGFRTNFGQFGRSIEGLVNFQLSNAFYGDADGDGTPEVAFGQGNGVDYAYDADVVYHEFGHAVFGSVVDSGNGRYDEYGRLVAASGLNEGSADFFSMAITLDPQVGEYAGGGFGSEGAIRDLEADRFCPADIYGQSHTDGEIWGSLGWNMIEDPAIGPEVASHAFFGALNLWGDEPTFGSAGEALLESIEALHDSGNIDDAQLQRMNDIVAASGFDDCSRVIALDEGVQPRQSTFGAVFQGNTRWFPMPNQYSIDAPEGTTAVTFRIEDWATSNEAMDYRVIVRRGEHVVFERVGGGGMGGRLEVVESDFEEIDDRSEFRILLDDRSDPPLEPGATYYFAVTSWPTDGMSGFGFAEAQVSGEIEFDASLVDDGDAPADGDGTGCAGCSSRLDAEGGAGWLAVLGLLGFVGLRRR